MYRTWSCLSARAIVRSGFCNGHLRVADARRESPACGRDSVSDGRVTYDVASVSGHVRFRRRVTALCDGWCKMLKLEHLAPTVTKRAQAILCNPLVPKLAWLVPNYCKLGTKKFTTWCQSCNPLVPKSTPGTKVESMVPD